MLKGSFHQNSIPDKVDREDRPEGEESSVEVTVFKLVFHIVHFKLKSSCVSSPVPLTPAKI